MTAPADTAAASTVELDHVVDTHLAAYCDPDPVRRAERIASVWADGGELLDPPLEGRGRDEIAALTDAVLAHYPGHRFERTTVVDEHHGWARYGWTLRDPAGAAVLTGTDVVRLDAEGRLCQVVGFFGDLAPVEV